MYITKDTRTHTHHLRMLCLLKRLSFLVFQLFSLFFPLPENQRSRQRKSKNFILIFIIYIFHGTFHSEYLQIIFINEWQKRIFEKKAYTQKRKFNIKQSDQTKYTHTHTNFFPCPCHFAPKNCIMILFPRP